jgi:pimeloyl-ACP methyl ester carboxylesterase
MALLAGIILTAGGLLTVMVGVGRGAVPGLQSGAATPPNAPPPVAGVSAAHRDGQTFVTWREAGPSPEPQLTMGALETWRRNLVDSAQIRYRVYRAARPIERLSDATLMAEVSPASGWNLGYYGYNAPADAEARRFVIKEGESPLAPGTGLFVHNATAETAAYYAVTVVARGVEARALNDENRSNQVLEAPGAAPPILQRTEAPVSFTYVDGATLRFYVRWEVAGNTSEPGRPFNYLVALPPGVRYPAPVGIHLHAWGSSMMDGFGWWFNAEKGTILVSSNQEPYDWWTGYHEKYHRGPPKQSSEWTSGVVRPYSQRRMLAFVDWLSTRMRLDLTRMFAAGNSMGGSGALMMAIRYPRMAWAIGWVGVHVPRESPQFRGSYEMVWGPPEWNVKFEDGTPVWDHYSDPWYLRQHPDQDIGFLTFSNGKNDGAIGWAQAVDFVRALQETRQPHMFVWGQEGHGQRALMPAQGGQRVMPLDLRTNQSLPAFSRGSLDDDPGNGDPASGAASGQVNGGLTWQPDSIRDEPSQWEVIVELVDGPSEAVATADITPRRLQRFKPKPGDQLVWTNRIDRRVVQSGEVTADRWGLVTVPQVQIARRGSRLTVELRPPR